MKRLMVVVSKSCLPILLVFAALYAGLLSVHLSALSDAEKVTVIQVGASDVSEWSEKTSDIGQELDAYRDPIYLKGIELLAIEKYAEVEQQVKLLQTAGNKQLSQLLAARLAYAQQQYEQAKSLFDELLKSPQPPMSAYFYRALTLDKLKQPLLALADYDRVVAANDNHFAARFNRADVALELGKASQAIADLKKATSLAGGDRRAKALLKLAQAYQQTKQENRVKTTLEEAIRFYPASVATRMELAEWYERDGQPDAAIHEYDLVRDMTPNAASSYVQLAKAYSHHKRLQSAEQAFRSALQLQPGYAPAQFGLADLLVDQGREQEVVELLNALLAHDADNSRAYFQLGRINSGQKHYVEALRYYQKVLSLNQNTSPETWLNIGLVYSAQKLPDKALQAYQTGTGVNKVLTDVQLLCSTYVPAWLGKDAIDATDVADFYADPVKVQCESDSLQKALWLRRVSTGTSMGLRSWRGARFVAQSARGHLREIKRRLPVATHGKAATDIMGRA